MLNSKKVVLHGIVITKVDIEPTMVGITSFINIRIIIKIVVKKSLDLFVLLP